MELEELKSMLEALNIDKILSFSIKYENDDEEVNYIELNKKGVIIMTDEEKKAIERIEDFLTTNIIISISSDETANSEELKAFISKNEYLAIEFIVTMFLKQFKEIEEYKEKCKKCNFRKKENKNGIRN